MRDLEDREYERFGGRGRIRDLEEREYERFGGERV